ncbi:MAG: hypothetical protein V4604_01385 [Bacteroidota bacterium]
MKKVLCLFSVMAFVPVVLLGQNAIVQQEAELEILLDSLRASKTDDAKRNWNAQFKKQLEQTLNEPTALTYTFTKLRTVGIINSPDNLVRVISWNVEQDDQTQQYFAYVLKGDERKPEEHKVIELVDNSFMLPARTDDVLEADNWYGALYYKIIPVEKNNKTYYTLLGWDGNTTSSNIKLIDVLYFSGNSLKLGSPLFKSGDDTKKRIYMEHSEKTVMSLRWDEDHSRIMFDHLSPETPTMEGFYEYYVPDMSYDAYEFNGNKWMLVEDVIGVNKDVETITMKSINPKTEEIVETEMAYKWIDPTTEGSPASKEVHVAVTPDTEDALAEAAKKDPKNKNNKDPQDAMTVYDSKRHKKEEKGTSISFDNGKKQKKPKKPKKK